MNAFEALYKQLEDVNMAMLRAWPDARNDSEKMSLLHLRVSTTVETVLKALQEMSLRQIPMPFIAGVDRTSDAVGFFVPGSEPPHV